MIGHLRRTRRHTVAELNITAFMNLMVVLVPFLLITAVFTQLTIKELNLPDTSQPTPPEERKQGLSVVVRDAGLTLVDGSGPIQSWPRALGEHNYKGLAQTLAEIKNRMPAEDRITLLLEPGVNYDTLIQVMDSVHYLPAASEGVLVDMFPLISVGDAPEETPAP